MGADFTLQILPDCKHTIDREIALKWEVEEMYANEWLGDWADVEDLEKAKWFYNAKEEMIDAIDEYFKLLDRRDVGGFVLPNSPDGIWYIASGGMSDIPTESYGTMEKLQELWPLLEKFATEDRDAMLKRRDWIVSE